jgi:A/G-specific adenine glycosylase
VKPAAYHRPLLAWYDRRKRDLPWRRAVSPYRTWISEIMLQQTTVAAVIPYYERFLERFPDAAALARAGEDQVLALWAGLGYYSRARNLHRAAKEIVEKHGGEFPSRFDEILDLPGIGRYTAGAIASIAFGQPAPLVDGNVARVFSRLFALRAPKPDEHWALAETLVSTSRPGDWNQALMELGATVCAPENPACGACPLASLCKARKAGLQDEIPAPAPRKKPVPVAWTCLWIERNGEVLLWKRSQDERFLKGQWGLPEARHLACEPGRALATARHTITHHALTVSVREAKAPRKVPPPAAWVGREKLGDYLISSLWKKCRPRP